MSSDRRIWLVVITAAVALVAAWMPWLETRGIEQTEQVSRTAAWSHVDYMRLRRETYRLAIEERWSLAIPNGELLVEWRDDDPDIWRWLGTGYHVQGDYHRAAIAWEQAANFATLRSHSLVRLAAARTMLGDLAGAFEALERAQAAGYRNRPALLEDQALLSLQGESRFHMLLAEMEETGREVRSGHVVIP